MPTGPISVPVQHGGRQRISMTEFFALAQSSFITHTAAGGIFTYMHPGYCPQCGERVTPFAAGCALCGAELDPHRWQRPVSAWQRLSIRFPFRPRLRRRKVANRAATLRRTGF
jgi:predicted amidophosphoribosyltransferase